MTDKGRTSPDISIADDIYTHTLRKSEEQLRQDYREMPGGDPVELEGKKDMSEYQGLKQFTTDEGFTFFPAGATVSKLTPGVYQIGIENRRGVYFRRIESKTDGLIKFPETNSEAVIDEIAKFWDREEYFKKYGLNYKRGIFLWGPPGSGKSCAIQLVISDVIKRGGVVFQFCDPGLFSEAISMFRQIQPDTPVVVLLEDIDSIIATYNESSVLNILDGVNQISKVVYLATTNYPEKLGERILNRPSRFDKRFKMGHPKSKSRRLYFENLIDEDTKEEYDIDIEQWVEDTRGMSIAHLKELFVSHCILGNPYNEAIATLRSMVNDNPKSSEDFVGNFGFCTGGNEEYD